MKKALLLALTLVAVAPVAVEAQQDLYELVRQGDTYFKRSLVLRRLKLYTGEVITGSANRIHLRGNLRRGKWHGAYREFTQTSYGDRAMLTTGGEYNMGQKCGRWTELTYRPGLLQVSYFVTGSEYVTYLPC